MNHKRDEENVDRELELAKRLASEESMKLIPGNLYSEQQRAEFQQAAEGLNLLRLTRPTNESCDIPNEKVSTIRVAADQSAVESQRTLPETQPPGRIGKFHVIKEAGRGGFGIVVQARDEAMERDVALKIPHAETLLTVDSRKRFQREAKAAGILSHPAIVPIYECGQIGLVNYIAFAYCDGTSLDQWIENRNIPITPQLAASITAKLADAVSHAHRRGVIHRDLKPTNILVDSTLPDDTDFAQRLRITDFGLALLTADDEKLTLDGALVGTPSYMSPEQAQGQNKNSPSIDIYALGVILYQLLTGKLPFRGKSNLAILKAITETTPESPSRLNRSVPGDLTAICMKCLEKEPQHRYASASELNDDLVRFLEDRPIRAKNKSQLRHFQLWIKRNPILATLAMLFMLSMLLGTGATWQQYRQSQRNLQFADSNFKQAKSTVDELLKKAMSIELAAQPKIRKEMLSTVSHFYEDFIAQGQDDPSLSFELAAANRKLGAIERTFGNFSEALEFYDTAQNLLDETVSDKSAVEQQLENLANLIDTGLQFDHLKQLENAVVAYEDANTVAERMLARFPEHVEVRVAYSRLLKNIGAVVHQQRKYDLAMVNYEQSELIRTQLTLEFPDDPRFQLLLALAVSSKVGCYIDKREFATAIEQGEHLRQTISRLLKNDPDNLNYQVQNSKILNRLGDIHRAVGKPDDLDLAIKLYEMAKLQQEALAAKYPLLEYIHASLDNTISNLGQIHVKNHGYEKAAEQFADAIERAKRRLQLDSTANNNKILIKMAHDLSRLGDTRTSLGQREEAASCYAAGLKICRDLTLSSDDPAVIGLLRRLTLEQGKTSFALGQNEKALEELGRHHAAGGQHSLARTYIARIKLFGGQPMSDYSKVLEQTTLAIADSPKSIIVNKTHAAALCFNGRYKEAIQFANKCGKKKQDESLIKALALAHLGEIDEARKAMQIDEKFRDTMNDYHQSHLTPHECDVLCEKIRFEIESATNETKD